MATGSNGGAGADLREAIRTIQDYPKPGIAFRDISTLLGNPRAFRRAVDELVQPYAVPDLEGRRDRGTRLHPRRGHCAPALLRLRADPQEGQAAACNRLDLLRAEYGTDTMEIHVDAVAKGERVILVMT